VKPAQHPKHMLWKSLMRDKIMFTFQSSNLSKFEEICLLQRGKHLCWMFCSPHKSDIIKRHVWSDFFSKLILKERCFIYFSHCSANPDCFNIYMYLSLYSAKNKIIFYLSVALFSGFCVHKWGHKLQSTKAIKKLIFILLCLIQSYG